jgi:hypothetical protein
METATRFSEPTRPGRPNWRLALRGWSLLTLAAVLLVTLASCGTPTTSSGGAVHSPATATPEPGSRGGIGPLSGTPGASPTPASAAPSSAPPSAAPSATPSPSPSAAPSVAPSATPLASAVPSASTSSAPSAPPASAAPSAAPSQSPLSIPATAGQACPDAYPWGAYIGPEGEKWYRSPNSVAIFYRQPATLCFVSDGAAQAAGYCPTRARPAPRSRRTAPAPRTTR